MSKNKWIVLETDAKLDLMSQVLGVSPIIARIMANRGLRSKNVAKHFLNISMDNMRSFFELKDAEKAVKRIATAIKQQENIVIYGDYDADGITSTAILYKVLTRLGAVVSYYIPHRVKEGYGLNIPAIDALHGQGAQLIIALDNGISAIAEIAHANTLGIDTVVIDHHEPGEVLPSAYALVDPKQEDCAYGFKDLCTGGLTYKLVDALVAHMGQAFVEKEEMLVLAAVATVCDIVGIVDENRIIVNMGLEIINRNKLINPGLGSLLTARNFLEKPIDTQTVGFVIGPFINASGRLDTACKAVDLLIAPREDIQIRTDLTQEIIEINNRRKEITTQCVDRILESLPSAQDFDDIIVVTDPAIHESIAGIVAGRIKETTGRPTIVLTQGEDGMKGSGRSIKGYNMFQALSKYSHLLLRFGGHTMAAGLTIAEENIPALVEGLNNDSDLRPEDFLPQIEIDMPLAIKDVHTALADDIQKLAPFGSGNKEPMFVSRRVIMESVRAIDDKNTLIFHFMDDKGVRVKGVAFGLNKEFAMARAGKGPQFAMDIVYTVENNTFNGYTNVQLRVKDFVVI